jgi:hypothetical protein
VFTGNASHTSIVHATAFLPWVLWRLDAALRKPGLRQAAEAGALLGLSALAGYPGIVTINICLVSMWALGRSLFPQAPRIDRPTLLVDVSRRDRALRLVRALGLCGVVCLLVLATVYVTFLSEAAGFSDRGGPVSRNDALKLNALSPSAVRTLASPHLVLYQFYHRFEASGLPFEGTDFVFVSMYTGAALVWLALVAVWCGFRSGWRWWVLFLGLGCLAASFGDECFVRGLLYDWVLPTRYFRHSGMFRGGLILAVCVLAAEGTRDLAAVLERRSGRGPAVSWLRTLGVPLAGLVCAAGALAAYFQFRCDWEVPKGLLGVETADLHAVVVWGGVLVLSVLAVVRLPWSLQAVAVPAGLVLLAGFDQVLTAELNREIVSHEDRHLLTLWHELDEMHVTSFQLPGNDLSRATENIDPILGPSLHNKNYVLKYPVVKTYSPLQNRFLDVWVREPVLLRAITDSDRIWFAPKDAVAHTHLSDENFTAIRERSEELGAIPLVLHSRQAMVSVTPHGLPGPDDENESRRILDLPAATHIPLVVHNYATNRLIFEVNAPEAGYVLLTDRWARGWSLKVNGTPTEVEGGNFLWRAFPVPAGNSVIEFRYRPFGYPWLFLVSWSTLAGVGLWSLAGALRRWRRAAEPAAAPRTADATEVRLPLAA